MVTQVFRLIFKSRLNNMIHNILVPVDFSQCSKNALRYSIKLAKAFGAKIYMVNAVHIHSTHPDVIGGSLIESVIGDYEEQIKESFEALESEIVELQEVPHEADRFLSYLIDAIYTEVETKGIDLIVMGTRDEHSGFEHLFGSRATDVIASANVPVLTIPEAYQQFKLEKIGFASDLTQIGDSDNLAFLNSLGTKFNAEILAFAIVNNSENLTLKEQRLMEDIKKRLSGCNCSVRSVEASSIVEGITDFTKSHELDMLAMIPKEHSFLERLFKKSVTRQVVMDIKIPMISFRE